MKKIIAAFDGLRFCETTLDYALYIAMETKAPIVGVFLNDMMYHSYGYQEIISYEGSNLEDAVNKWNEKDEEKRSESVQFFENACRKAKISFSVRLDKNVAFQELLQESIYADLIIINKNESFSHIQDEAPSRFMRFLLADVQCPVLLVPDTYKEIDKLVFLYDGGPASVYAVKMLSYLLPSLSQFVPDVITVQPEDDDLHNGSDNKLMKEFMKRHWPTATYHELKGNAEVEIISMIHKTNDNPLVILGAYHRGTVSRWFKPSMADHLMKNTDIPLFIAHNK